MSGTAINKNDARFLATQELLETTFLQMLERDGFEKITVRKIVTEAGLNRGTFYLHALDKQDLLEQIEHKIFEKMMIGISDVDKGALTDNPASLWALMMQSASYIGEHKETILMLMSKNCDPLFFDKYSKKIKEKLFPEQSYRNVEEQYVISLMGSIVGGLFGEWVRRGMKETPKEYIDIVMGIAAKTNIKALSDMVMQH